MSTHSRNTSLLRSAKAAGHGTGSGSTLLALPIIECGSVCMLLQMLPAPTSVLLMPISRREGVMGSIKTTTAVHITACLTRALEAHPAVACVQAPARYRIPDEWLWSHPASLEGSGIRFDETTGHWRRQGSVPQAGEQAEASDEPCR